MPLEHSRDGDVTFLRLDHGKVNALDHELLADLGAAVADAGDAAAIVLTGRPGMLSAGLDMAVMGSGDAKAQTALLVAFGRTMLGLWTAPRPVVVAATGHAVAGGTILCLAADHAVAARGSYRWGLVETTIGFALPTWIITMARHRLPPTAVDRLLLAGRAVDPETAVSVGFADELADPDEVEARALAHARDLAALPAAAFAQTKHRLRGGAAAAALHALEEDTAAAMRAVASAPPSKDRG